MRRVSIILAVLVLALAARASAQVRAGDASMDLNATVSAGYADNSSNLAGSDHSFMGGGAASLSGSYYNPNFLSFSVSPFYNQSRLNSTFQSISASSGVSATANIFSGSHFPGSISYSDTLNSSGNFGIPGLANYMTHGNSDTLAVNWGVHLENLPSLNLSFSNANNAYSIYGASTQGNLHSNVFSATSSYHVAGFNLNGGYQHSGVQAVLPEILAGEPPLHSDTGTNSFSFGVGHNLPWNGSISAAATRMKIGNAYGNTTFAENYDTTIDTLSGGLNFAPTAHLSFGENTYYTDNLQGTLFNTLLAAGVSLPPGLAEQSTHDLSLSGYTNYELPAEHLNFNAFVQRQQQTFLGASFASDSYNGTVTYSNALLGGQFNGVLGVTRTSTNTTQQGLTGLNGSVNYAHQFRQWTVAGGFNYSQATQTVLIAYTSSGLSYNGSVGRRIGRRAYWSAYTSSAKSLLTNLPGSASSSSSYSTSLSLSRFSINGSYSNSNGNALLTPTGLVPTPLPLPVITPGAVVLYNGRSYSMGIGASPKRGLTFSASYAQGLSDTRSPLNSSNNNNETAYFLLMYNFRKIGFTSGYSRLVQGFSLPGTQTARVNSFYVGISRWFSFF